VKKAATPVKKVATPVKKAAAPVKKAAAPAKKAVAPKKTASPAKKTESVKKTAPIKKAPITKKAAPAAKSKAKAKAAPAKKAAPVAVPKAKASKPAPAKAAPAKKSVPAKIEKTVSKPASKAVAKPIPAAPSANKKEATKVENKKPEAAKETSKAVAAPLPKKEAEALAPVPAKLIAKELEALELDPVIPFTKAPRSIRRNAPVAPAVSHKPVANPITIQFAPNGKSVVKFAPIAIVEKTPEKEKISKTDTEDMAIKTSPRLAFQDAEDKKGISAEEKLRALFDIQIIDTRIDKIHAMRGELPLEVEDLENELEGLKFRLGKLTSEIENIETDLTKNKQGIKDAEALIKKYNEQINNVKNNREFDSLNKEIEYQTLEIQLLQKRIREAEPASEDKRAAIEIAQSKVNERENDLQLKRNELAEISKETEKEEKILKVKSDEAKKKIDERLLSAYERIRSGAPNGMAVVPIEREASAGSFIQLPPQKQLDVAARKRVIVDEHSGRILVDADLAREEQEKMDALLAKELGE
jgi:predicted  nucleic acid-binding Zn-ribbon protein